MDQADYRAALRAAQAATGSFAVPLSDRLLFVAKDTQQKRNEHEPTVSVTVAIPNPVSVQEATELVRSVQQVMEIKKFGIDNTRRIVVMSDRISKVRPAQELFKELLHYKTEIVVDLEFIEVDRNDSLTVGLTLPNNLTMGFFDPKIGLAQIAGRLVTIGGGMSLFGLAVPNAQFVAKMRESNGRTLLRARMRSTDGTAANFHVGDKYPILTGGYFGGVDTNNPNAYRPPPQFTFEDLGIVVKVTPKAHGSEEVALNVEAEFKVLAGAAVNGIPIISNRKVTAQLTVKNGEWGAMAGMLSGGEARSISGIAGLAQIPGLGALLRQHTRDRDTRDVLILLRPVVISGTSDEILTREIWVGPEGRPNMPL
jgi:type II secretory pathway component GspD/PulD (secretin)